MPVLTHIHTYVKFKRNKYNQPNLFRCADPHCTHFEEREHIIGKASLCNKCGDEFVLTREDTKRSRPICINCADTKEAREHRQIKSVVGNLLEQMEKREKEFPL